MTLYVVCYQKPAHNSIALGLFDAFLAAERAGFGLVFGFVGLVRQSKTQVDVPRDAVERVRLAHLTAVHDEQLVFQTRRHDFQGVVFRGQRRGDPKKSDERIAQDLLHITPQK